MMKTTPELTPHLRTSTPRQREDILPRQEDIRQLCESMPIRVKGGVGTSRSERCHLNEDHAQDSLDRLVVEKTATSDEAHFWLNGYINKQNCRIWSEANLQVYVETPLHPEKLTVWCALWAGGILLQKR
ncbi:hypothetical protein TNCV_5134191 [Trichonephila clavipes]|nr:hypothetical protein TNCV_5134191 [Trichonephila clavipes]